MSDEPASSERRPRRKLLRFAGIAVALLLGLAALEIAARVMHLGGDQGALVPHDHFDHWHFTSYRATAWSPHGDWGGHPLIFNSDGIIMEAELPAADVPSLVFVGDSFTAGKEVAEADRWVTRVGT